MTTSPDNPSHLTPLEEVRLIEAHRDGDPGALGALLRSYQKRLFTICIRMVRHRETANDLTQDALVKIIEGLPSFDGRAKFSTWAIRVTMNCCLSHLRKQKLRRHPSLEAPFGDPGDGLTTLRQVLADRREPDPERRVEQEQRREAILAALEQLSPQERGILVLRDMQDLDYQQVSEVLSIPVGTVKSRIFRSRASLRSILEQSAAVVDEVKDERSAEQTIGD